VAVTTLLSKQGSGGPRPALCSSVIIPSFEAGRMGLQCDLLTASLNKEQKERIFIVDFFIVAPCILKSVLFRYQQMHYLFFYSFACWSLIIFIVLTIIKRKKFTQRNIEE
jgi:hypothetical protein